MNFSSEDRKAVFQFFEKILHTYTEPVYCEYIRGHVSNAPPIVRKYVLTKLRGEHFLEYFRRRKNYFIVEKGHVLLKAKFLKKQQREDERRAQSSAKRLKSRDKWSFRRSDSLSSTSTGFREDRDHSIGDGEREHEEFIMNFFTTHLRGKEKIKISSFEFELLPKKVKWHLSNYYNKKVRNYFQNFPNNFLVDDEGNVSLLERKSKTSEAKPPDNPEVVCNDSMERKFSAILVDPEIQNGTDYLESVEFYVDVLKNQKQPFPIDKLGGYLSQASKNVKDFIKFNYPRFKLFFNDAPLIFLKNTEDELTLSDDYRALLRKGKRLVKIAGYSEENFTEMSLKSRINTILQPQLRPEPDDPAAIDATDFLPENHAEKLVTPDYAQIEEESNLNVEVSESFDTGSRETLSSENASDSELEDVFELANQERLMKFIFSVELYCLEMVEKEVKFSARHAFKTVEYFISILTEVPFRPWNVMSLKGTLGRAPSEIAFFINKLYKGDKFLSFFQEHPEFQVTPPFVTLSPAYKEAFSERQDRLSDVCSLPDLYETSHFKSALMEAYSFILEVLEFLKTKTKTKLSRLEKIMTLYPTCFEWIKSSIGETISEKTKNFLSLFVIFEFLDEGGTTFLLENDLESEDVLLLTWLQYMLSSYKFQDMKCMPFSQLWCGRSPKKTPSNDIMNNLVSLVENSVGEILKMALENEKGVHYHEFAFYFPVQSLFDVIEGGLDSRILICAVLENKQFQLRDGTVTLNVFECAASDEKCTQGDISRYDKEAIPVCDILNEDMLLLKEIRESKDEPPLLSITIGDANPVEVSGLTDDNFSRDEDRLKTLNVAIENCETQKDQENISEVNNLDDVLSYTGEQNVNKDTEKPLVVNIMKENNISQEFNLVLNECAKNNFENDDELSASINHQNQPVMDQPEKPRCVENGFIHEQNSNLTANFPSKLPVPDFSKMQAVELNQFNLSVPSTINYLSSEYENTDSKADLDGSYISENKEIIANEECENYTTENVELNCSSMPQIRKSGVNHSVGVNGNFSDKQFKSEESVQIAHENQNNIQLSNKELNSDFKKDVLINTLSLEDLSSSFKKDVDLMCETSDCEHDEATHESLSDYENEGSSPEPLSDYESGNELVKEFSIRYENHGKVMADCSEDQNLNPSLEDKSDSIKFEEAKVINGSLLSENQEFLNLGQIEEDEKTCMKVPENNNESIILTKIQKNPTISNGRNLLGLGSESIEQSKQCGNLGEFTTCKDSVKTNSGEVAVSECNGQSGINHEDRNFSSNTTEFETLGLESNEIEDNVTEVKFLRNDVGNHIENAQNFDHYKSGNLKMEASPQTECLLQPLTAEVVLLTVNSCIATTEIDSRKQNIYFLKCVFSCDDLECCSECFDDLRVGDTVSCFISPAEMTGKMWIACMVSVETSSSPNGVSTVSETLQNQLKNATRSWDFFPEGSAETLTNLTIESKDASMQTVYACDEFGCQTACTSKDSNCQTSLSGNVKLCAIMSDAECQTNPKYTKDVSMQAECKTTTSKCQTEISGFCTLFHKSTAECQTDITANVVNSVQGKEMLCQTDLSGNVKRSVDVEDVYAQTISTGAIMITQYLHM